MEKRKWKIEGSQDGGGFGSGKGGESSGAKAHVSKSRGSELKLRLAKEKRQWCKEGAEPKTLA